MTLHESIDKFSSWRGFKVTGITVVRYDRILRIFCLYMRDKEVEDVTLDDIILYLQMMCDLGWKKNGINLVCIALRKLFEFLAMQGFHVLNSNLIPLPKKEFNIPRICTESDYNRLISAISPLSNPHNIRNLALASLVWDTGARIGEVLSLNINDLDLKNKKALIKTEKSRGKRPIREIFWTETTNKRLKAWLQKREHLESKFDFKNKEAVFISISKCAHYDYRGLRMTSRGTAEVFRGMSNRAGIKVNAHSMRHHMGRYIIEKGGVDADVSNILGHSHADSARVYTSMFGTQLEKRYRLFNGE